MCVSSLGDAGAAALSAGRASDAIRCAGPPKGRKGLPPGRLTLGGSVRQPPLLLPCHAAAPRRPAGGPQGLQLGADAALLCGLGGHAGAGGADLRWAGWGAAGGGGGQFAAAGVPAVGRSPLHLVCFAGCAAAAQHRRGQRQASAAQFSVSLPSRVPARPSARLTQPCSRPTAYTPQTTTATAPSQLFSLSISPLRPPLPQPCSRRKAFTPPTTTLRRAASTWLTTWRPPPPPFPPRWRAAACPAHGRPRRR